MGTTSNTGTTSEAPNPLPWHTGPTWRLRVELADRPGALARLTARLADRHCNVLALSVLPVPGGVVDDIVVAVPSGMLPADLIAVVQGTGGRCVGLSRTDQHDLVDGPTAALRTAAATIDAGSGLAEALRVLLGADSVTPAAEPPGSVHSGLSDADTHPGTPSDTHAETPTDTHEARIAVSNGELQARRGWAPFTAVELARAAALAELVERAGVPGEAAQAVLTADGAGVVLRPAGARDEQAVAEMHRRLSTGDLATRYRDGIRTVRGTTLIRLLRPPKGRTTLAVCGSAVVGVGQLVSTGQPHRAELALLVEPDWRGRGVGTALLRRLVAIARGAGITELYVQNPPERTALARTAMRAGLAICTQWDGEVPRMSVRLHRTDGSGQLMHPTPVKTK